MTELAIKLAARVVIFGAIFALAAHRHQKIEVKPRYALPLVGLVFAVLNTGLYWLLKSALGLAVLGPTAFVVPLLANGLFVWATDRLLKPLRIEGLGPMAYLAVLLTAAHAVLYLVLDGMIF